MIKSEFLDCSMRFKAKSIVLISAEKIEALSGNRHLYVSDGVTQADPAVSYQMERFFVVVVALLFYVQGKHLRSCWGGQLT